MPKNRKKREAVPVAGPDNSWDLKARLTAVGIVTAILGACGAAYVNWASSEKTRQAAIMLSREQQRPFLEMTISMSSPFNPLYKSKNVGKTPAYDIFSRHGFSTAAMKLSGSARTLRLVRQQPTGEGGLAMVGVGIDNASNLPPYYPNLVLERVKQLDSKQLHTDEVWVVRHEGTTEYKDLYGTKYLLTSCALEIVAHPGDAISCDDSNRQSPAQVP